jgi:hypothetical protein
MAPRSKISTLPPEIKAWLDDELVRRGFADYVQLAADLQAKGADVSKSGLHRYGSDFEGRLAQLKVSAEQARAIVNAAPDDDGAMNEALIRITQEKLMGVLVDLEVDPKKVDITKLTRSIADLARSSVSQKKWQVEMRQRATQVAAEVAQTASKAGMSDDTVNFIRSQILGIADKKADKSP